MLQEPIHDLAQAWGSAVQQSVAENATYGALAVAAKRELSCHTAGVYLLHPGSGTYQKMSASGDVNLPRSVPGLSLAGEANKSEIQQLLAVGLENSSATSYLSPFYVQDRDYYIAGIRYMHTPYSFIVARGAEYCQAQTTKNVMAIAELAFLTFQNRAAHTALHANERPLDITLNDTEFYDGLRKFIVEATGMQLVILRARGEYGTPESKNLRGVVTNGWDEPLYKFDLIDYARFPSFEHVIAAKEPLFRPDPRNAEVQAIWNDHPHLKIFESFALFPIVDDQQYVTAVLTIGSTCHLDLIPVMEAVVKGTAQTVGYTLRNRDLHFEKTELQSTAIETAAALNAIELYSDLTHQMGNAMAAIPEIIEAVDSAAKKGRDIPVKDLLGPNYLGALEEAHDHISILITQATAASSVANDTLQSVLISNIWKDATSLVEYRLHKYGISVSRSGDVSIDAYPLQLRQVFFHLLLNSIDAFAARSRKQPRIDLYVHKPKDSSGRCLIRYADNAGGINPVSLRRHSIRSSQDGYPPLEQLVFMRGVTSRKTGSGNGLWVVRQILQRHSGGISLVSYKENTVFDISLPMRQAIQEQKRREY